MNLFEKIERRLRKLAKLEYPQDYLGDARAAYVENRIDELVDKLVAMVANAPKKRRRAK